MRGAGRALEERRELAVRAAAGDVLQRLAAREHQHDDEGGGVLADGEGGHHRHDREDVQTHVPAEDVTDHPDQREHDEPRHGEDAHPPCGIRQIRQGEDEREDADDDGRGDDRIPGEGTQEPGHGASLRRRVGGCQGRWARALLLRRHTVRRRRRGRLRFSP